MVVRKRKKIKSSMQSLIIVGVIALIYLFYGRNSSEVKTYVDYKGKEQFKITVSNDLMIETNLGEQENQTKEASTGQGIYVYFDKKREEGLYFYIVNSDKTFDYILEQQSGSNMEVVILDTGELFLKKDSKVNRVYGNIHFSQLGYGAYLNMSEETYTKQQSRIQNILNSYQLIEE